MLFNTDPSIIQAALTAARTSGMLQHTEAITGNPDIPYFTMPANAPTLGRAVIAVVHMNRAGHIDMAAPEVYGVVPAPIHDDSTLSGNPFAHNLAQQFHVVAEKRALRNGILKPHGRSAAELATLDRVPYAHKEEFAAIRVPHLAATVKYVLGASEPQSVKSRVIYELVEASAAITDRYPTLR